MEHLLLKVLKTSKKLSKKLNSAVLLIILGLCLFLFGGINYYRIRVLSFTHAPKAENQTKSDSDLPIEISIPSIQIKLAVVEGSIKNGAWEISANSATHLSTSGSPGEGGNTVIYGHNKKIIFANLPYLSLGRKILIKTQSGKTLTYEVYQKDFVGPDRIDLVSPTSHEELTLYTCWGLFDSQRAVVKAKPIASDKPKG